ncbi:MAG: KH domain-containing protein [Clostridia bacterium]|nr:KH domain-containing protein [Clostridia bacterium]
MRSIEKTGKKTEDAINAGLKELGCDLADVTIDILDAGSPGLFGMFGRLAKVRLTVKEADPDLDFEMPTFSLNAQKTKTVRKSDTARKAEDAEKPVRRAPESPKAEETAAEAVKNETTEAPAKAEKPEKSEKAASPRRAERSGRRERAERPEKAERPAPKPEAVPFEPTDPETLGTEGRIAYDFLKNVTEKMGVPVAIRVTEEPDHLSVAMMGDTLGILIGRRGDTLDALQYLTSLQVNKHRDEYMRVSLDTENYRAKREEALTRLALRMAGRARKTGRKVTMEPMNPYERRVLHSALQGNPHVTTHSEGEEPYRRVVITLKNDDED